MVVGYMEENRSEASARWMESSPSAGCKAVLRGCPRRVGLLGV